MEANEFNKLPEKRQFRLTLTNGKIKGGFPLIGENCFCDFIDGESIYPIEDVAECKDMTEDVAEFFNSL